MRNVEDLGIGNSRIFMMEIEEMGVFETKITRNFGQKYDVHIRKENAPWEYQISLSLGDVNVWLNENKIKGETHYEKTLRIKARLKQTSIEHRTHVAEQNLLTDIFETRKQLYATRGYKYSTRPEKGITAI